jgi:phosphoesterase RecJ-like protein
MDKALLDQARAALQNASRILVLSHIRPDGDAVGSLLGLGLSLQASGKQVQMVLADGLPKAFHPLSGSDQVSSKPDGEFDLIVAVDSSDLTRIGNALEKHQTPDLNIDHHPTNVEFARINLVDPQAVATAEILAEHLPRFGLPIGQPVAEALLFGIIADTIGFRTYNMTPKALRLAADLMEAGANLPELYGQALLKRSFEAVRYWGVGLCGLQREGKLVWTTLTQADRQAVGYPGRDDADLINVLSTLEDAEVVVVFTEQNNGHVKVSWRAQPGYDVSRVALDFGGGGHTAAAGADIPGSLPEVQGQVLDATRKILSAN